MTPCPPVPLSADTMHARSSWIMRSRYVKRIRSTLAQADEAGSESDAPTRPGRSSRSAQKSKVYPRVPVAVEHWDGDATVVDWF